MTGTGGPIAGGFAGLEAHRLEDGSGFDRHAGIDQHGKERRQAQGRADDLAPALHHARARIEADRNVGPVAPAASANSGIVGRESRSPRQKPQGGRRVGGATAEPGADGRRLTSGTRP